MRSSIRELSVLAAAIAEDRAAKAEALQHGLLATQPLSLVRLSELCALGDRMLNAAKRIEQAGTLPPCAPSSTRDIGAPIPHSSLFRYFVAHSVEAVSPADRAMHPKSQQQIDLEYSRFDVPFRDYFSNWPRIEASFEGAPDGIAIELVVEGGTNASVAIVIQHFLARFNRARPGFALVSRPQ